MIFTFKRGSMGVRKIGIVWYIIFVQIVGYIWCIIKIWMFRLHSFTHQSVIQDDYIVTWVFTITPFLFEKKNKANIILFFVSIKFISNFKCYFVLNFVIQKEKKERKKKKRKKENKESELKIDDHFTLIDSHYKSHFEKTYFY